VFLLT
jgi:hypothetical protein